MLCWGAQVVDSQGNSSDTLKFSGVEFRGFRLTAGQAEWEGS